MEDLSDDGVQLASAGELISTGKKSWRRLLLKLFYGVQGKAYAFGLS